MLIELFENTVLFLKTKTLFSKHLTKDFLRKLFIPYRKILRKQVYFNRGRC